MLLLFTMTHLKMSLIESNNEISSAIAINQRVLKIFSATAVSQIRFATHIAIKTAIVSAAKVARVYRQIIIVIGKLVRSFVHVLFSKIHSSIPLINLFLT